MAQALVFDIGGVLTQDIWENLLLDEKKGVAAILKLDRQRVCKVAQRLWDKFAHRSTDETHDWKELELEYWNLFIEEFQLECSADYFISLTEEFVQPITGMIELLEDLKSRSNVQLAICSNNTEFWFQRQMERLHLHRFFHPNNIILSSRIGISKSSSSFQMFKAVVNALEIDRNNCIFIDDRQNSVLQAVAFGMVGILFPSHSEQGASYLSVLLQKMGIL